MPFYRVVCAIIKHPSKEGFILAAQRSENDRNLPNLWEFPGGKIEDGETLAEALQREIKEELDLEVKVGDQLTPSSWTYPQFKIELVPFLCEISTTAMTVHEHQSVAWISIGDLRTLKWAPADVPIVEEILTIKDGI